MKKLLIAFLLLFISSSISFSQENLKLQNNIRNSEIIEAPEGYYFESFEGPVFPPADWRVVNIKGHRWSLGDKPYTGKYSAYMPYGGGGELDWLIMPRFSAKEGDSIKFYYRSEYNITFASLWVLVSTKSEFATDSSSLNAAFTDTIAVINLLEDIRKWKMCSASLSKYAGQNIYITFKLHTSNNTNVYIDNVGVGNFLSADIASVSIIAKTSSGQGIPVPISAELMNMGAEAQNFNVYCSIPKANYISEKTFGNLPAYDRGIIEFDPWIPADTGDYVINVYSGLLGDLNKANDTVSVKIKIMETLQGLKWQTETALPEFINDGGAASYIKSGGDKSRPDTPYVIHMGGRFDNIRKDNIWKYNTLTKQWAESDTSLPVPLYDFSPIQVEDKIYITGGWMPGGVSSAMYIYDPEMDTIGRGADIPIATIGFVIGSYADSLIYVMGGGTSVPRVQIYNINSNSWKEGTPYPRGALYTYGGICGSKIVLTGKIPLMYGFYLDSANTTYIGEIDPNDPYTISWKKGKDYPSQAYYGISAGAWQGSQRKIVCLIDGNYTSSYILNDIWIYDVEKDNWYAAPNKPTQSSNSANLVYVVRNDSLFIAALGGYNSSEGFLNKNEWLYIGPSDLDTSDIGTAEEPNSPVPVLYSLSQNYPNPFNPATTIKYSIAEAGKVELKIYNMLGQEIRTLVNEMKSAGRYEVKFNAPELSSGVYIYRIRSGSFVQTKKLMLVK